MKGVGYPPPGHSLACARVRAREGGTRLSPALGVLYCIECGRWSGELGTGWVAMRCDDPDAAAVDEPSIALYCPPCAAGEFGYRADVAAKYVCAWEPLPLSVELARAFSHDGSATSRDVQRCDR